MKSKAVFKYNNGNLALLCTGCRTIIKTGLQFTEEEFETYQGKKYLPPQYCGKCKEKNKIK